MKGEFSIDLAFLRRALSGERNNAEIYLIYFHIVICNDKQEGEGRGEGERFEKRFGRKKKFIRSRANPRIRSRNVWRIISSIINHIITTAQLDVLKRKLLCKAIWLSPAVTM